MSMRRMAMLLSAIAALGCATAAPATATPTTAAPAAVARAAAAATATPKAIARISALHGHALYAKHGAKLLSVRRGQKLPRGTWLVIGPRTNVRIRITIGRNSKLRNPLPLIYVSRYKAKRPKAKKIHKDLAVLAGGAKLRPVVRVTNHSISSSTR